MTDNNLDKLLNYLWRAGTLAGCPLEAFGGERVEVVSVGEPSEGVRGVWLAAEAVVDGERRRGAVAVGTAASVPDGAVLRVVCGDEPPLLGSDDRLVTQVAVEIPPHVKERYDALRTGRGRCPAQIKGLDGVYRTSLYTRLLVERLHRKTERIYGIFRAANGDWHQTFHTLLFQAMGGDRNKGAFTTLAQRADWAVVSREKGFPQRVEALLLGTAGFLFADVDRDDYTLELEDEARHLIAKHVIVPMRPAVWELAGLRPMNHPALRLAEIAALVAGRDFMLDGALACRTVQDVERLFAARASDYWRRHYSPSDAPHPSTLKTIGRTKTHLIGINLVAPLMFAYGKQAAREELCEAALDLLATIPAERNRKLERWYDGGCVAQGSFDSQALLELDTQYCTPGECAECRVGRAEIKKAMAVAEVTQ